MNSNLFFDKAFRVLPENLYVPIVDVVTKSWAQMNSMGNIGEDRMVYMFKVYNKYLRGSKVEDIKCKGCRTKVFGKMKMLSDEIVSKGLVEG